MDASDSRTALVERIQQCVDHPALDAETLGRAVLMLEWFVQSGLLSEDCAVRLLAERMVGAPAA